MSCTQPATKIASSQTLCPGAGELMPACRLEETMGDVTDIIDIRSAYQEPRDHGKIRSRAREEATLVSSVTGDAGMDGAEGASRSPHVQMFRGNSAKFPKKKYRTGFSFAKKPPWLA